MSRSFKEWRESMIKEYPICRKCGESTTSMNSELIILGTENIPKVMLPKWYSEHKNCPQNKKRWTKNKED